MGAKSCEKSLETFALDHNPAIWFANFSRDRSGDKSCTAEIIPVRVSVLLSNIGRLFSGITQPNTQTHTRASPTPTHTTRNMESIDNQSEETVVAAAAATTGQGT